MDTVLASYTYGIKNIYALLEGKETTCTSITFCSLVKHITYCVSQLLITTTMLIPFRNKNLIRFCTIVGHFKSRLKSIIENLK